MADTPVIMPAIFGSHPEVRCGVSTRKGGVSPEPLGMNLSYSVGDDPGNVDQNRGRFFTVLGISRERLAVPRQCHSAKVQVAREPGIFDATDGLVTNRPDLWLAVTIADCAPVFLFDPVRQVVAGIHSGWRGAAAQIVERGVALMKSEFSSKPEELKAYIGPSAGPCCYEVGGEVAEQFGEGTLHRRDGAYFLDLKAEAAAQLRRTGVARENIEVNAECTICSPGLFHSYRRDGSRSGRMMGVIGFEAVNGKQ